MTGSRRSLAGIVLALAAVACFAALDTATKWISLVVPALMALWFRYLFQALATTLVFLPRMGQRLLHTEHPRYQALRGSLLLLTSVFAFFSLKYMPVGEFTAVVMFTPLAITLVSALWLKEPVSWRRWALVVGGFLGTMVVLRPGGGHFGWAIVFPLALVASNTAFQLLTSRLARTENPITMHFYTGWTGTVLTSLVLPWVWVPIQDWQLWAGVVTMGLMGTVGHFLLILAYQRTSTATLMPYMYAQIAFAMLGGWMLFSHVPDHISVIGMVLIALCGAAGAWLTVHEHRPTSSAPKAP